MLLDLGYGDLDVSDIKIGETAISSYEGVETEITTSPTLFAQDVYEASVAVAMTNSGDTATRTTQGATTEISLDLVAGQGLFGVNDKGKTTQGTVNFTIQYRKTGTSTWSDIGSATGLQFSNGMSATSGAGVQVVSSRRETLRSGVRWKVASGQYDVKVTRSSESFPGAQANGKVGGFTWTVLRSFSPNAPSSTGTLKLAVRIKATDQLNGIIQNLSVLAA